MASPTFPNTPEAVVAYGVRELALLILARLTKAPVVNRINFIAEAIGTMPPPTGPIVSVHGRTMTSEPKAAQALAEAWDWLFQHGLLSPDPVAQHDNYFVTRRGYAVAADSAVLDEAW
jgi:hypothetical protein